MFSIKSLRAKSVLSALIPIALVLVAVAIIALYAYEQVARDLVQQRDTELARVSAVRLSEGLSRYCRVLQSIAAEDDVQSMEPARLSSALEEAQHQLYVFDAGVVVYNSEGVALWSQPFAPEQRGTDFPVTSEFDKVRRTLRPAFSDVFRDAISGEDVILVGVPIVGSGGEFKGVLAGMFKMKYPLLGPIYAEVLQLKAGRSGYAYLVDGNGKVIYHPDGFQVGRSLAATVPVDAAIRGETGAVLTEDPTGESIISSFAPVPGTGWGLIIQERWGDVAGLIRGYSKLLLGLLVVGGVISGALIFFATGRILKPIKDLTLGAQRIAGGDFDYTIAAKTGDEIQALAQQFNIMASALKTSYTDLERRVADRTKELATLNAVAQTVSRSLELKAILTAALDKVLEVLEFESGAIYVRDLETGELQMACHCGLSKAFRRVVAKGIISARAAESGNPIIIDDLSKEPDAPKAVVEEGYRPVASIPLLSKGQVQGVLTAASRQSRRFRQQDVDLLLSIGNQIGVAIENARFFEAEQRRAEQFRVINEVGRQITSILDIDEVLVQVVRLIQQAFDYDHVHIGLIEGDQVVYKVGAGHLWDDPQFQFRPARLKVSQEGITGWVAAVGEPLLVPDVSQEPRYVWMRGSKTRSELTVPIKVKGEVIGVLDVQSDRLNAFDESDLTVLHSLANQAAIAIENARLFAERERRIDEMAVLNEVGRAISSTLQLDELLDLIHRQVSRVMDTTNLYIALYDRDEDWVSFPLYVEGGQVRRHSRGRKAGQGLTEHIIRSRQPLLLPDDVDDRMQELGIEVIGASAKSWLGVPMIAGDEVLGVITVQSYTTENVYDEEHLNLLPTIAAQAAIAIENARLYEQAQQLAVMEERQRLARELHDAVTQTLFSASLIAEALPTIWESDQDEGQQLLQDLRQLSRGALAEMRTLLMELRPAALVEANLDDLLRQLGEAIAGRTGVPVTVTVEGQYELPPNVHVALYRIAQEALNNVVKHARASQVAVSLHCAPQGVELQVSDDGRGFNTSDVEPGELGLGIMRERAQAIGASLKIESQPGHGTQVTVVWEGTNDG